ncbi:MAG: NTP transferase domain-containing protein, partial [Candidatus Brocadiia bacterium]
MGVSEAFLLCGGGSRRLGFPKEMLRVDGVPLAVAMVRRLREVFPQVAVVTNRPDYLEHWLDVPVYRDEYAGLGPLAGVHAGLSHTQGRQAFFLGCDMPLVTPAIMRRLIEEADGTEAAVTVAATPSGPEPLCGVYDRSLLPALEERLGCERELSARDFVRERDGLLVELEGAEAAAMRDVDRPTDMEILASAFGDVDPLPTRLERVTRVGGPREPQDVLVEERPYELAVNGTMLLTMACLPIAVRELAVGALACLGLIQPGAQPPPVHLDRDRERVDVELDVCDEELRGVVGPGGSPAAPAAMPPEELPAPAADAFCIRAEHILCVLRRLRVMAPV